jgi:CBS-domain-containing membrane protein
MKPGDVMSRIVPTAKRKAPVIATTRRLLSHALGPLPLVDGAIQLPCVASEVGLACRATTGRAPERLRWLHAIAPRGTPTRAAGGVAAENRPVINDAAPHMQASRAVPIRS